MSMKQDINGIILLNKPLHLSSNKALQVVKGVMKAKKAGHTGSLDPLATGMLPICLGEATKFSQFLLDANKAYQVSAKLGAVMSTGDLEGEVVSQAPVPDLSTTDLEGHLKSFMGDIDQVPPMHSAIKQGGQPLYKLARQGKTVERKSRRVTISQLQLLNFDSDEFELLVSCSKGTYIRSLVEDIGQSIGCGAHVTKLYRKQVVPFEESAMISLEVLKASDDPMQYVLPVDVGIQHIPVMSLTVDQVEEMYFGRRIAVSGQGMFRLYHQGTFIGIGEVVEGLLKPVRLLVKPL